jgi:hypothetical protein
MDAMHTGSAPLPLLPLPYPSQGALRRGDEAFDPAHLLPPRRRAQPHAVHLCASAAWHSEQRTANSTLLNNIEQYAICGPH